LFFHPGTGEYVPYDKELQKFLLGFISGSNRHTKETKNMWVTGLNDRETFSDANDSVIVHFEDGWHDEEEIESYSILVCPTYFVSER